MLWILEKIEKEHLDNSEFKERIISALRGEDEDRKETGYDDVSAYDIIKDIKNGEHLTLDEVDKLTKYKNAVLVFMSSKDIYVLEDKYKELVNKD